MATFISTIRFTQQGITNIKDTTKRANAFKAAAKKLGVSLPNSIGSRITRIESLAEVKE